MLDGQYEKVRNKALNFLSYSLRTQKEISDRLDTYLYKTSLNEKTKEEYKAKILEDLDRMSLIDDQRYAQTYIENKAKSKIPPGRRKINNFLYKKGIERGLIEESLGFYSVEDEAKGAYQLVVKRNRSVGEKDYYRKKSKITNYLVGRGYSFEAIEEAFKKVDL